MLQTLSLDFNYGLVVPQLRYFCPKGKFTCHDLSCISIVHRCDGKTDCPNDRADEEGCRRLPIKTFMHLHTCRLFSFLTFFTFWFKKSESYMISLFALYSWNCLRSLSLRALDVRWRHLCATAAALQWQHWLSQRRVGRAELQWWAKVIVKQCVDLQHLGLWWQNILFTYERCIYR